MTVTANDPIIGPARGSVGQVLAYVDQSAKRKSEVEAYVREVYRLAPLVGIDPLILVGQACLETDSFASTYWNERLNPAGIGVTGDPAQNAASHTWANGTAAARGQIVHMWQYTHEDRSLPTELFQNQRLDPRLDALRESGFAGTVHTIADLAGRWAVDPNYAIGICRHANAILATKGDTTLTFGNVKHLAYEDRPIWKSEGAGQNNLGQRDVLGVTWHRILGSLRGTDTYFRRDDVGALTDYGIGVEAEDGAGDDGVILRWNDPLGIQSGWASGPVNQPYGDGLAFVNLYGINAVNKRRASIEISGFQNTPLSEKSRQSIAAITAYWADQAHIAWDVFPITSDGFSFVCWHQEFTIGTGKLCPFDVVIAETADLIERTRAILRKAQTSKPAPKPKTYAAPAIPGFLTKPWTGHDQRGSDGTIFHAIKRQYKALGTTKRLQRGDKDAPEIGPPIKAGETFEGDYWFRSKSDGRVYVLTVWGSRVYARKLSPTITVKA